MDLAAARVLLAAVRPLVVAAEETDALLRRKLGTDFRYADYAVRGNEVPLNRILCDFLDPRGPHGQGGAFLRLFLRTLKPEFAVGDPTAWRARHNFPTSHGRLIDIVLVGPDRAAVGLECKPWTTESDKQLDDYATFLLERFQPEKVWLVFLPGVKRNPETLTGETRSKLGDRFKTVPFTRSGDGVSVVEWLEECAGICEADKVARFLRDLVEYLDSKFPPLGKEQPMADKPSLVAMVGFISTNADYIKSAFDIEEAMPQLRQQTAKEFVEGIKPELERDGWEVDNTFVDFSKRADAECMTYRRPHWPLGWGICLGKWEPMSSFYIGLRCLLENPN